MLIGFVSLDLKPIVRLKIQNRQGNAIEQEVLVDTGFNGSLLLSRAALDELKINSHAQSMAQLADGSEITLDAFNVSLFWGNEWCKVVTLATEGEPLIGMRLLENHELKIQIYNGGTVQIEPLG
jgi:clan AA aspartic protease